MGEEGAQRAHPRGAGGGTRTRGSGGRPRMPRAKIVGVGAYAPKRILSNADLEKMVETNDAWIVQRSGIRERHIADETEATSDLALKAAQQAIERANLVPEDIEFIAVGTTTPDMIFPSVGNIVQHRLGCRRAGSVDLMAACAGSVYSLTVGSQFIQTGKYKRVLCIGAETLSKITDFTADDVNLFIPHQANLRIIEAACKRVSLPMDRVFVNVDRYGNTGAASVYVALEEALAAGRIKRGDLVLMAAFGGGFAWGAVLM